YQKSVHTEGQWQDVPPTNSPLARFRGDIRTVMTALGLSRCARDREHIGQESNMTIYISQGRYTAAAIRAMTAKPENRSEAIAKKFRSAGADYYGVPVESAREIATELK